MSADGLTYTFHIKSRGSVEHARQPRQVTSQDFKRGSSATATRRSRQPQLLHGDDRRFSVLLLRRIWRMDAASGAAARVGLHQRPRNVHPASRPRTARRSCSRSPSRLGDFLNILALPFARPRRSRTSATCR